MRSVCNKLIFTITGQQMCSAGGLTEMWSVGRDILSFTMRGSSWSLVHLRFEFEVCQQKTLSTSIQWRKFHLSYKPHTSDLIVKRYMLLERSIWRAYRLWWEVAFQIDYGLCTLLLIVFLDFCYVKMVYHWFLRWFTNVSAYPITHNDNTMTIISHWHY